MAETPISMPVYPGQASTAMQDEPEESPAGGFKGIFQTFAWIFLAIFCLSFFTLTKLPEDRIKGFVQGNLSTMLASRGITMTVGESKISFLFGITYVMNDVTLNFPPPEQPAHIERIAVSPLILPLFLGKIGAKIRVTSGNGDLTLAGSMRGSSLSGTLNAEQFDLGKIGLLKLLSDISGSAFINGKADFSASADDLTSTNANIQLELRKIEINPQSIQGFAIPHLGMSEGRIDVEIDHGKGQIKPLRIGRLGSATDDIIATLTGDLILGKTLSNSTVNAKVIFSLSQSLLKSFALIDAILAPGKQPDGGYSYRLQGPLLSPNPIPGGAS